MSLASTAFAALLIAGLNGAAAPFPPSAPSGAVDAYQDNVTTASTKKCDKLEFVACATFKPITGSRVLILHVSCLFALPAGSAIYAAALDVKDSSGPNNALIVTKTASVSSGAYYAISTQTYLFVDKGQAPQIAMESTDKRPSLLNCSVSGMHA